VRGPFLFSSIFLFFFHSQILSVVPPERDAQAVTLLQQSIAAIAKTAPSDSSATGIVTLVEGSTTEDGTVQILTFGTSATGEILSLSNEQRTTIYSSGAVKETKGNLSVNPSMELALTDQCMDFPLPFLMFALSNPEESIHYIGLETLDGQAVQHLQVWNSFASKPRLQPLSTFSEKDIWIDPASNLPVKISWSRRAGGQGEPAFPVEVSFSNYTNSSGILYPFLIKKSFNGTPWQTITIQSVSFNTGLTATQFSVE
jgi:hypothetical protein